MVEKSINLLLVFCLLFSFTTSETIPNIIEFDENGYSQYFSGSATFKIDFNHGYEYIHVKVIPDNEGKNPIVSMSSEDPECKSSRKILRMQPYDTINLFFKKGELPYSSEYLCIKFPQEGADNERYKLEIKSEDYCQLTIGEQYSYFVDEKSTRMQFKFGYEPSSLLRRLTTAFNINFWVKGQSSPNVEFLGNKFISKEFEYGQVFSGEYENGAQYILRITAEEGDYITVGSLQITDNESKELKANDLEIMGFLKRDEDEICFPIKQDDKLIGKLLRFNGNAFTKAISYFKQNGEIDSSSFKTVENGLIENLLQYDNLNTPYSFCIKHQSNIVEGRGEILFSLQMTSNSYVNLNRFIYPPQIPGMIYSHYLLKGEIAVFQGMKPKEKSIEINFNMKAIKGFPDMLFDICIDFPNCNLDPERYDYKYDPHHSNRMTTYSYFLDEENEEYKEFSPKTSFQPLLIVKCIEGTNEEELSSQFCKFETSIFTDVDRMHIISGETLSQYLLENEEDLYTINIENENDLQKVYLDLIVFSGDVDLIVENDDVDPHKYYISNKIFYSIHVTNSIKIINFKVHAYKNAFYLVQHQLVKNQPGSGDINKIESGVNYIQSIFIGETASFRKNINFKNLKFDTQTPFLVSFYSQNCKYGVTREIEEVGISSIPINDNYGQLIIDKKDPYFKYDTYSFTIDIFSDDKSNYEDKLCVFYITGLELSNSNTGSERTISVSDGVSQYYIFTKDYPYIKYSYHISDLNNPVVINFNLIDKTSYIVKVAFGYEEQEPKTIYRNENIILHSSLLKELCLVRGEVCTININIELENKDNEKQTKLETTVFQVNGAPAYLEKNVMKQDILIGNKRKFYYLDIGKEDIGDITVDYKRGSGYIYAKVVTKMDTDFSSNPDWRGIYEFPNSKNGTLKYETYLKKIIINPEDTKDCDNGCYLLISIENSYYRDIPVAQENIEFLPYRITITPRIARSDSYDEVDLLPEIKMKVNEFVIGNLYPTDEKIYEYYKVTLPYDSEYLFIDWQADKSSLLINVGEEKPTKDSKHFQYNSTGYDTTFKLTKKQILGKIAPSTDTIKNVVLTLGIWNYQVDSLYTSVYAFKIFMPPTYYVNNVAEPFELIHIRSDQKVQCDPFEYSDNVYACIFAVVFDEADTNSSLIIYPKAQNENVKIDYIGALLEAEPIERNNIEYIMSKIDSLEEFKSEDSKFMYIEKIDRTKSLFFVVYAEALTNIEVLSSTYQFPNDWVIVPNPSTPQIFAIGGNRIQFNFETTKDLLINIVSLSGEGAFYWDTIEEKDIEYYLNGFEDRLTLTSTTSIDNNKKSFLVAQSNTFVQSKAEPGFVFYMTFYPRNNEYNIDQVKSGRSTEFNYREAKFPLNFYTRLTDKEVAISLTFYNFYMENGEQLQYHNNLYKIWGKIIKEEDAINARFDEYFRPINDMYAITGSVDGPFANLFFGKEDIEKFNINEDDNPTLFFSVDLGEGIDHKFKEIGVEVSILREQTDKELESFANENVYYHGKLTNIKNVSPTFRYKLKTGEMDSYMRIVFSTNSANVNWAITNDINSTTNYKGLLEFENNYVNGRYIMTFKIPKLTEPYLYLIVFHDKNTIIEPKLSNYIFKYMNAKNKDDFTEFTMDSNLEVQKTERNGLKTYAISFYPIEHHDVSYYIKGIYHNSKIKGEKKDTIAISESTGYNLQIENPEFNGASKVTVYMKDIKEEIDYIKVLAKVNFNTFKEFILYYPYTINEEQEDEIIPYENIEPSTTLINLRYDSQSNLYKGKAMNAYKFQKYKLEFDNIGKVLNYINVQLNSDENLNNKITLIMLFI